MKYLILALLALAFSGCAKHGMMVETGKDYKGRISVGWGPMTVIDADVAGEYRLCIPSKSAVKDDPTDNWCTKFMQKGATP